jgi:dCMP deaminase
MRERLDRDLMFMDIAELFAKRSSCVRGQVGAVIVVDRRIVSCGYNGAPPGMPQCDEVGCGGGVPERELGHLTGNTVFPNGCTRSIHAEANAVAWAARTGVPIVGGTLYNTHGPCLPCAQLLLASGIATVMYRHPYRLPDGVNLLQEAGVRIVTYHD